MSNAVTHFILSAVIIAVVRDFYFKKRYKENHRQIFPLHYVLIGGIAGILPDFDYLIYYFLSFFGLSIDGIHRTFSHNLFVPLIFLLFGFLFMKTNSTFLRKHDLKLSTIFFIFCFGSAFHLLLDSIFMGSIIPLYPIFHFSFGLDLVRKLPGAMQDSFTPVLDAAILIIWMIYIELKHKISDFI